MEVGVTEIEVISGSSSCAWTAREGKTRNDKRIDANRGNDLTENRGSGSGAYLPKLIAFFNAEMTMDSIRK